MMLKGTSVPTNKLTKPRIGEVAILKKHNRDYKWNFGYISDCQGVYVQFQSFMNPDVKIWAYRTDVEILIERRD